jgi:hypothetical protein
MRGHERASGRSGVVGLSLGLVLAGCVGSSQASGRAEPDDESWGRDTVPEATTTAPSRPLPGFDELVAWTELGRVPTGHPGGARRAALRTSPEASGYGRRGRAPFAPHAVIVASLHSSDGAPALAHYLMRKREPGYFPEGGDWEYAVVSPEGRVLAEGRLVLCARCHAEATREHVFEPLTTSSPGGQLTAPHPSDAP